MLTSFLSCKIILWKSGICWYDMVNWCMWVSIGLRLREVRWKILSGKSVFLSGHNVINPMNDFEC